MNDARAARRLRIAIIGAGTMARAHSAALTNVGPLYPDLALRPQLVAVADVNTRLATDLGRRFGYQRVHDDGVAPSMQMTSTWATVGRRLSAPSRS